MNIPEEVIVAAARAAFEWPTPTPSTKAEYVSGTAAAAQVIAEWARKEALREAATAAQDHIYENRRSDYGDTEIESLGITTAAAIRALVEGEPK